MIVRTWGILPLLAIPLAACSNAPTRAEARAQQQLENARQRLARDPQSEGASVWLGRRLGYVGRYEEAVEVFSRGLVLHPESAWLLRFRGHRYITLRRFDAAVTDLERAHVLAQARPDEVEPDGQPNPAGIPIGSLRSNIDYHLGLAQFLRGDFEAARLVYARGLERAHANPDRRVSHGYWYWLTLKKCGRDDEAAAHLAAIDLDAPLLENQSYCALLKCFRGEIEEDDLLQDLEPGTTDFATCGFGLAMRRLFTGDDEGGKALLRRVVASGPWAAFGAIAAEVERMR